MNRNTELHFSQVPQINMKRSKFEMSHSHKTSFNAGDVIPIYIDADILPGDTVNMNMAELIRMATPIYPIMDNLYADIYWFFVPHRLVWDHWQAFWGENDDPWTQTTPYEIPQIEAPSGGWTEGTIADYMGIPTKVGNISVNALPFRAYAKIWSDWFRDENLKNSCHIYTDETTRTGSNGTTYVTDVELGGAPAKAAKFHDYFTSALPEPQKGDQVTVPLTGELPVYTGSQEHIGKGIDAYGIKFREINNGKTIDNGAIGQKLLFGNAATSENWTGQLAEAGTATGVSSLKDITPVNLYTSLSQATTFTINQLRTAFAIQKYYENAGLHGWAKA